MDLRSFELDLLGRRIKTRTEHGTVHEFVIDEVYPHQVRAHADCENGYTLRESFSEGDLILNGALRSGNGREFYKHLSNGYGL